MTGSKGRHEILGTRGNNGFPRCGWESQGFHDSNPGHYEA